MNIHLRTTYRGRMRNMKRILVVKAMVLGAIACSISAIGFAAGVGPTHIQDATNMQQNKQDTEKHETAQSNWMDRTDIKVGTQSKVGTQVSIETLQPLTHYDENSKSVLFVQGGIGRGGQEHSVSYYHGYHEIWYPYNPVTGKGDQRYMAEKYEHTKSLGTVANVGLGYRHLSKNEHAYVGVNAFVDRAFSENANRVSGGLEYVSGLNEVRANVYRGLGSVKSQSDMIHLPQSYFTFDLDGGAAYYMPHTSQKVLSGYDISYARTFKNARWARVHATVYHWNGLSVPNHSDALLKTLEVGNSHGWKVGTTLQVAPHVSLDVGYTSDSKYTSGAYGVVKYTLGTSKFAWHGGKHSDDTITNARARMLDKVDRSPITIGRTYEEDWYVDPNDHL